MKSGIINKILLEKDIDMITHFSHRENKCLSKIINAIDEEHKLYSSSNSELLLAKNNSLINARDKLRVKRGIYTNLLNRVIIQYNIIAKSVVDLADSEEKNK